MRKNLTWEEWKKDAVKSGALDGLEYCVLRGPAEGLNGYVCFPSRPVRETGYSGILTYVPVHGGITFATDMDEGKFVYGFDTAHCDSDKFPRDTPEWIVEQINIMVAGIKRAVEVEEQYLLAHSNEDKARAADAVWEVTDNVSKETNFGVSINLLAGKL